MKKWGWTILGSVALGAVVAAQTAPIGPLTPWPNAKGRTDSNGYVMAVAGAYAAPDGPLTPFSNLRVRTDANGYLIVTFGSGGSIPAGAGCISFGSTADTWIQRVSAGVIGVSSASCGGANDGGLAAKQIALTYGSSMSGSNRPLSITGTFASSGGGSSMVDLSATFGSLGGGAPTVLDVSLSYGSSASNGVNAIKAVTNAVGGADFYSGAPVSSIAIVGKTSVGGGGDSGSTVGTYGIVLNSNSLYNIGAAGSAQSSITSKNNIGVIGMARNSSGNETGVYAYLGTTLPTMVSAAIVGNNGSTTTDILNLLDNGTSVFRTADGGATSMLALGVGSTSIAPTSGEAWFINAASGGGNRMVFGRTANGGQYGTLTWSSSDVFGIDTQSATGVLLLQSVSTSITRVGGPLTANTSFKIGATNGNLVISATAPTIASGFGTSPSIPTSNGTAAFTIDVGTGGAASTGVLTMPAATNGWACSVQNLSTPDSYITSQTATTTTSVSLKNYSRTTGLAIAWTASDILSVTCTGR